MLTEDAAVIPGHQLLDAIGAFIRRFVVLDDHALDCLTLFVLHTWAFDCSQPASQQNPYIFYRVIDADHVARDTMNSPTNRVNASIADFLIESNPNEVVIVVKTERGSTNLTVRLERKRMRTFQSTRDTGEKVIVNGRFNGRDTETLWYSKCGS